MLVKSIYTHTFERNLKYYLYNSQTNFFSEISQYLFDTIKDREWENLSVEERSILLEKKIILNSDDLYNFFNSEKIRFLSSAYREDRLSLVIVPTTACNFACPYCFEPKNRSKTITDKVMCGIVDYINSHRKAEDLYLTWYGGEPLLAFNSIRDLYYKIATETKINIKHHSITTNGFLFSQDIIQFFKDTHLNRVQITLDGIKSNHDAKRFLKGCHGETFDRISDNILQIATEIPDADVSIRVNINRNNYTDFIEVYNHYNSPEMPENISVYPGVIREETSDKCSLCQTSYKNGDLFKLNRLFKENGVKVNLYPRSKAKGCMMQKLNSIIIGPEGEIYKCWNDVNSSDKVVGNILSLDKEPPALFYHYVNSTLPFDDRCKECLQFPICDGGCGYHRHRNAFENCFFDVCNVYGTITDLEDALISSLDQNSDNYNLRI